MMAVTVLGFGGSFPIFSFITPILTDITGFSSHAASSLLVVFGVATLLGNMAGGRWGIDITSHVDCVGYGIGDIGGGLDSSTDDGSIAVCVGARCVWYVTGLSSRYVGDGSLLDTQSNRFCFSTNIAGFNLGITLGET